MVELDFDFKKGIVSYTIKDGGVVEKLTGKIHLKSFYRDLHDMFVDEKFYDLIEDPDGGLLKNFKLEGESPDNKKALNRTADIFEKRYTIMNKGNNSFEWECIWKLYHGVDYTEHGWFEITINFECRTMSEVEELDGNKKKKLQKGDWEFRNEVVYKNSIIKDYLKTIPFVKNSENLQKLYINNFYRDKILHDIEYGIREVLNPIYKVMNKHFDTFLHKDDI